MTRDRFLFRAGRTGYSYPELLELRRGSVRILVPSKAAKGYQRTISTLIALGYVFIAGLLLTASAILALEVQLLAGFAAIAVGAIVVAYFVGLIAIVVWWDNRSLPLLAENPSTAIPIELLGIKSFRTFQELRARSDGRDMRVTVAGPPERVEEAVRFAGLTIRTA